MPEMIDEKGKIESTTIGVYRTSATVKGGRRFSFGALVVVGDRNGKVGFGYAKGNEVPNAMDKSQKYGSRALVNVRRQGTTIHHDVEGKFGPTKVRLIPASPGTGIVAGTVVRAVLELAGISDCLTKCYGSTNPMNVLKAVFDALSQLRTPDLVAALRNQTLETTEIEKKIEKGKAFMPAKVTGEKVAKGPVNTVGQENKRGRGGPRGGRGGPRGGSPASAESGAPTAADGAPAADAPKA
jgi:small subunit ribosomal protein S5